MAYYERNNIVEGPPEIAAFDCSAVTLLIACAAIHFKWSPENYGDAGVDIAESLSNAAELFRSDHRIILVGVLQSGFESAMYLFVFMWTMALEEARNGVPIDHGMIFAGLLLQSTLKNFYSDSVNLCMFPRFLFTVFMESCLIGTTLNGMFTSNGLKAESLASYLAVVAATALFVVPQVSSYEVRFFMFIVFECCVGVYFPTIGGLRGKYVPDSVRATVMNIFRIPLNVIVVVVLYYIDGLGMYWVFMLASMLLLVASAAGWKLSTTKADDEPLKIEAVVECLNV